MKKKSYFLYCYCYCLNTNKTLTYYLLHYLVINFFKLMILFVASASDYTIIETGTSYKLLLATLVETETDPFITLFVSRIN